MHDPLHLLLPIATLLAAGVLSAAVLPRFGIPSILGYFAAGVLVGPSVTGWVPMSDTVAALAEFGVIFLLFDIGLHFSLKQLWEARKDFLVMGPLQWLSTTALIAAALWYLDAVPTGALIVVAGALALSSTAVALQTIADRGERDTPLARSATALLIFQDVVAVILLAIAGSESGDSDSSLALALGKAVLAIGAVAVIGRLLRPAFARIVAAGIDEAFTAAALLVVVVTAGLTGLAGLSLPLGAFLGGMLLSESEYCYMVKTELKPFRGLLLGLFFITVGMSLDVSAIGDAIAVTFAAAAALLVVKSLLVAVAARATGTSTAASIHLGFVLGQGSEFAFVILTLLVASESISPTLASILTAAVVITMALTPVLAPLGGRLASRLASRNLESGEETREATQYVLISGASDAELTVAKALVDLGHRYLVLDTDPAAVAKARTSGFSAGVGDPLDPRVVESFDNLDALIIGRTEPEESADLIQRLKRRRPDLTVFVRVSNEAEAEPLEALGAVVCVSADDPDGKTLAIETLRYFDTDEDAIASWAQRFEPDAEWEKADKAHAV